MLVDEYNPLRPNNYDDFKERARVKEDAEKREKERERERERRERDRERDRSDDRSKDRDKDDRSDRKYVSCFQLALCLNFYMVIICHSRYKMEQLA